MFSKNEAKRNLLGCLDSALLLPSANKRFTSNYSDALRSFIWPILLFSLTLFLTSGYTTPIEIKNGSNAFTFLYSMRIAATWALYLGAVYWISKRIDRKEDFCKFVIASNWLAIPTTIVFLPVFWLVYTGQYSWEQISPVIIIITLYTYLITAYMTHRVLRIPTELAIFITIIGVIVGDQLSDLCALAATIL